MEAVHSRILVVEDNKLFVDTLKYLLKGTSIKIDWATSAQEALSFLKENSTYAVAIIDQHLPGIKGDELATAIKRQYPELQIIFATGDLSQDTLTELLQSGLAIGFIPKGHETDTITKPIKKLFTLTNKSFVFYKAKIQVC